MSYLPGGHWATCDRCGGEFRHYNTRKEWTGYRVCKDCLDHRSPQEKLRGRADKQAVRDPRPRPADVFLEPDEIGPGDIP